MLTLEEFVYRLDQNKRPFIRYTNEQKEKERFQGILDEIENRDLNIKNGFYMKYKQVGKRNHSELTTDELNTPKPGPQYRR